MKRMLEISSALLSLATSIYTIWYMHFGVAYKNSGALSKIGLVHHDYFVIWGVLTFLSLSLGIVLAYKRNLKTNIYIPFLLISAVGMKLTLGYNFDYDIKPDYYYHCIGSLGFSVATGICIFLLFLLCYNKGKIFKTFTYLTGGILISDLILLLIFKETGLIEAVPIFAGYIMLGITNLRRDRVEATR